MYRAITRKTIEEIAQQVLDKMIRDGEITIPDSDSDSQEGDENDGE